MTLPHSYSYTSVLADAQKITWRVEDLIGADRRLDFERPFLPHVLAGGASLSFLGQKERLWLNQLRGASYLHLFQLVEEFILPFVVERAREGVYGDKHRVRALLTFAEEEAKHQVLFRRFSQAFRDGFPEVPSFIGPPEAVAKAVLSHDTLGLAILVLHLEWLTQAHYVESVKADDNLDPLFSSLLRHHWQEEAQHAKLDTLLVEELAAQASPEVLEKGFRDFAAIVQFLDDGLLQQARLDLETFEKLLHRRLTDEQRSQYLADQNRSYRWTFLISGLDQPNFVKTIAQISPTGTARVRELARSLA